MIRKEKKIVYNLEEGAILFRPNFCWLASRMCEFETEKIRIGKRRRKRYLQVVVSASYGVSWICRADGKGIRRQR